MKQCARGNQIVLVEHALGQGVGVDAGFDPAEQACGLGGKSATVRQRQLDAARPRLVKPRTDTFGMPAQLALVNAPGQRPLQQRGRGQRTEQLGIEQPLDQIGRRGHETYAPAGCQNLGKPADINRALQAVQYTQARRMVRCQMAVGVVFGNVKLCWLASCNTRCALPGVKQ